MFKVKPVLKKALGILVCYQVVDNFLITEQQRLQIARKTVNSEEIKTLSLYLIH